MNLSDVKNMIAGPRALACAALAAFAMTASPAHAQIGSQAVRIDTGGQSAVSKNLTLPLNKAAIVELPKAAADVLVSQPSIVDAVIRSPRRVYLLGLESGQTNAFFFDSAGRQILNLEITVEQDMVALQDMLDRLMPESRIELETINGNVILRGVVQSAAEAANASDLATRFIGTEENVLNMIKIRDPEQVMLKVRIVEMQRQLMKQLGISTDGTVTLTESAIAFSAANAVATTGGLGVGTTTLNAGPFDRLDTSFQAFETNGLIRILAEPNLTAMSGESARFLAGGEFPVPVGQEDGVVTIEFKEFGVGLGFSPVVLGQGRINIELETEVSEVTTENAFFVPGATTVDENGNITTTAGLSIPGLTVRRANTTVELPSGASLVMAGLLQEDMRQTIEGVPAMKDIPVLGSLFRSRNFQNSETELVIMVTPYLVKPAHESELTDPTEGFVTTSDAEAILMGRLVSTYGLAGSSAAQASLQGPMGFILD